MLDSLPTGWVVGILFLTACAGSAATMVVGWFRLKASQDSTASDREIAAGVQQTEFTAHILEQMEKMNKEVVAVRDENSYLKRQLAVQELECHSKIVELQHQMEALRRDYES